MASFRCLFSFRALLTLAIVAMASMAAHGQGRSEAAVKVAFLYHFFKFIDWPDESAATAMTLCTNHDPDLTDALSVLPGKRVNGLPIQVVQSVDLNQIDGCHMLFLQNAGGTDIGRFLSKAKTASVITVSDDPDFINAGGIIGLVKDDNHLAFEINLKQAASQNLHIDAQLLKLARRILSNPESQP